MKADPRAAPATDGVRACCGAVYGSEAVRFLLGDSFHPGGARLTRRLLDTLAPAAGDLILDIAAGAGTSAILAASEKRCRVIALDLTPSALVCGATRSADLGLSGLVHALAGDAQRLPLGDAAVDGALCECALCLFADGAQAAREVARVLRPGARLALSDVTAVPERLPAELRSLAARVACIGGARPLRDLAALLERAGLTVETVERHDDAMAEMLRRIEARLRLARWVGDAALAPYLYPAEQLCAAAQRALADGTIGYGVVIARRAA